MYPYGNTYNVDYSVGQSVPTSNLYSMNNTNPYGTVSVNTNVSPFLNNNPYGNQPTNIYGNQPINNQPQYPPNNTYNNPYPTLTNQNSFTQPQPTQYGNYGSGGLNNNNPYGTLPNNFTNTNVYGNNLNTLPNTNVYGGSSNNLNNLPNTNTNVYGNTSSPILNNNPYGLPPTLNTGMTNTLPNTNQYGMQPQVNNTGLNGLPPNTGLTGLPPNTNPYGLPPTNNLTNVNTVPNTNQYGMQPNNFTNTNVYGGSPNMQPMNNSPQLNTVNPQVNTVNPQLNEELQKRMKESEEQKLLLEKLQREKDEIEKKRQQELLDQHMKNEQERKRLEEQMRQMRIEQERLEKEKKERELENQRLERENEENRQRMETEKRRILLENRKKQEEMDLKLQQTIQEKEQEQQRIMQIVAQKMKEEERINSEKEKQELIRQFQQKLSLQEQEQQKILEFQKNEQNKLLEQQKQMLENQKQSWEIEDINSIIFETIIGKGQFGEVWKGKLHGKEVAIKKLLVQKLDEQNLQDFKKELNLMSHLRHPNLLMLMAASTTPGNMMIVTPLVHKGSLDNIIHSNTPLSLRMRLKICKDIAVGMCWLHNQKPPIVHRDLKPANILIDLNWNGIVADFGLCQIKSVNEDFTGSPYYMSPELLLGKQKKPSTEVDVYAYGISLWEIFTRQKLYDGEFEGWEELTDGVALEGFRPALPKDIHPFLKKLMEDCWEDDPQKRPNFSLVVNSNILDQIMIDYCISEQSAGHFWKSCFINRTPNDAIGWMEFVQAYGGFFQMDWKGNEIKGECLKALACNEQQVVEIESFGRIAAHFGPCDGLNFLSRVHEVLESGWFHGPLSPGEADLILQRSKRNGTYLVRFALPQESNGAPAFSLSVLNKEQGTLHHLILVQGGKFVVNNKPYDSLSALLLQERKDLGLGIPCTGSKYETLFPEEKN